MKVNKIIYVFIAVLFIFVPVKTKALNIPQNACYLHVNDSSLGEVKIYIPCDDSIKFSLDEEGNYILVSSEQVFGYVDNVSNEVISFKPYELGYYYDSIAGTEKTLDFDSVIENCNVNVIDKSSLFLLTNNNILNSSILLFIGGTLWLLIFMRH